MEEYLYSFRLERSREMISDTRQWMKKLKRAVNKESFLLDVGVGMKIFSIFRGTRGDG